MDALDLWDVLAPYKFAVKPRGTAFPYFCSVAKGDKDSPVKARLLMLEGWQTLHDFVRTRIDHDFGFYSSPLEFPRFELVVTTAGRSMAFRYDAGFMPQPVPEDRRDLVAKILWEAFGVFLRVESDRALPLRFADGRALFARVEGADGTWADEPLEIPDPPPHKETVSLSKDLVKAAQDLPFVADDALELDFGLLPKVMTDEPRPRTVYELVAADAKTGEQAFACRVSLAGDASLRALWEEMPSQALREIVRRGKVPGEIRVRSGRVFRLLRPLCMELPFKLSLHDRLERI